jgi:hypothetical protein
MMRGASRRISVVLVATGVLVLPSLALAGKTAYEAHVGKHTVIGFDLKEGSKTKIVDFSWDGLSCGADSFTAGLGDPITVKSDGSFKSKQPVAGAAEGVQIEAKLKGQVNGDASKVNATLKLTGDCENGKVDFTAKPTSQ